MCFRGKSCEYIIIYADDTNRSVVLWNNSAVICVETENFQKLSVGNIVKF